MARIVLYGMLVSLGIVLAAVWSKPRAPIVGWFALVAIRLDPCA